MRKYLIIFVLLIVSFRGIGQSSQTLNAGVCVDSSGVGTLTWATPSNATGACDAVYSKASFASGADIKDYIISIVKSNDVIGSTNKASGSVWSLSNTVSTYGTGTTDLWGENWSYSDINSGKFGVVLSAERSTGTPITNYLKARNFGFTIPSGTTIQGISVAISKKEGACILEGSFIYTPKGNIIIGNVKIGDIVLNFNEISKKIEEDLITNIIVNNEEEYIYYIYINNENNPLKVTGNHQVYTSRGYIEAENLKINDVLLNDKLEKLRVVKIYKRYINCKTYDLSVKKNKNIFINDILIHNAGSFASVDCFSITVYYTASGPSVSISSQTNVNCYGGFTGSMTASASGGTSPYTYKWNNNQSINPATGLSAATYTVTVTDNAAGTGTTSGTLTQPASALSVVISSITHVGTYGGNNGAATASAGGGTTSYSYLWSNAQTTTNITGLVAGTYIITVTDAHSCTASTSANITQPSAVLRRRLTVFY